MWADLRQVELALDLGGGAIVELDSDRDVVSALDVIGRPEEARVDLATLGVGTSDAQRPVETTNLPATRSCSMSSWAVAISSMG